MTTEIIRDNCDECGKLRTLGAFGPGGSFLCCQCYTKMKREGFLE